MNIVKDLEHRNLIQTLRRLRDHGREMSAALAQVQGWTQLRDAHDRIADAYNALPDPGNVAQEADRIKREHAEQIRAAALAGRPLPSPSASARPSRTPPTPLRSPSTWSPRPSPSCAP